jgi:hypothetical protein
MMRTDGSLVRVMSGHGILLFHGTGATALAAYYDENKFHGTGATARSKWPALQHFHCLLRPFS